MKTQKRDPEGLMTKRPIALRLMPDERRQATEEAAKRNQSESSFARDAYLKGLPLLLSEPVSQQ